MGAWVSSPAVGFSFTKKDGADRAGDWDVNSSLQPSQAWRSEWNPSPIHEQQCSMVVTDMQPDAG